MRQLSEEKEDVSRSQVISDVQQIYLSACGKSLSEEDSLVVARALATVRDTERQLSIVPKHLMQSVFENNKYYGKTYFPCDVIQLRQILEENKIRALAKIVLFSNSVAQKIIRSYKCILILNIDPDKLEKPEYGEHQSLIAGGMTVVHSHEMDIKDRILGIIVTKNGPADVIRKIVSDVSPTIPVYESFMIPGIDREKFASHGDFKKFRVHLPVCNIHNEIVKSTDEYSAVEDALDKAWMRHPDRPYTRQRPARYSAEYWLRSGFWSSIVDPDNAYKEAQSQGTSIKTTSQEEHIFATILDISRQFNTNTTFRVAGGWVRDRLLGKNSDDIDIAMDNLTGAQFYSYARKYGEQHPDAKIGKSYTVDMNVEKSKHLETVAVEINGSKIDFVNLRSESYGSDSRIPTVEFGTPEIDAQRRDLTINSLFYNINNGQVEDFVGGMKDLQTMTLRTPLDPKKTFTDDPLRMLRVLRFNSRFPGSKIDPQTFNAMAYPDVQEAYRTKVAPERAGPELYKLLAGPQAASAIRALFAVGLDRAVFDVPETKNLLPLTMDQKNSHHMYNLLEHTLQVVEQLQRICLENNIPEKERALMLFAAIFHDYGKAVPGIGKPKDKDPSQYGYLGHEDESAKISEAIGKRIGFNKNDRDFVQKIVSEHMKPHLQDNENWTNKGIGRWLQRLEIPGQEDRVDTWKYVFWHAEADTIGHGGDQAEELKKKQKSREQVENYLSRPKPIVMKPLIDGQHLMQMFPTLSPKPVVKGGVSFIKEIQNRLMDEQLAGNISTPEEALQFIESIRPQIESSFGQPKNASRWYDLAKYADAGNVPVPETSTNDEDVIKMIRRHPGDPSLYEVGDRIRRRQRGIVENQAYGKVTVKKNHIIYVKWDDKKEIEKYDINEVETTAMIERV